MTGTTIHKARILPALALFILTLFVLVPLLFSFLPSRNTPASLSPPSQEERLILYTSMQGEVIGPLVREFENRTGIWVSVKTGGSLSELSRISSGAEAGWDVMLAPKEVLESRSDLFAPARDLDAVLLSPSQTVFPYVLSNIAIIYNTKLVTLYPPDSLSDLLEPVWRGRIAVFDPQDTGEGFSCLQAMSQALSQSGGESVSSHELSLVLSGHYFSDMDELIRAVADGTCYIGVVPEDAALRAAAAGYDITIVLPQEKISPMEHAMAVLSASPRQDNAGKFLSFLMDETIQDYLRERFFFCPSPGQGAPEREACP